MSSEGFDKAVQAFMPQEPKPDTPTEAKPNAQVEGQAAPTTAPPQPEPEEPEEQAAQETQEQPEATPTTPPAEKPKLSRAEKRIHELVDEREYWRRIALAQVERPGHPAAPERFQQPQEDLPAFGKPKPKLDDFSKDPDPYAALTEAIADWKMEKRDFDNWHRTQRQNQIQVEQQQMNRQTEWYEKVREEIPNFEELSHDPKFTISPVMVQGLMDSEHGVILLQYLDAHRDEAKKIYQMPPLSQIRALGRLEDRLESEAKKLVAEADLKSKENKKATKVEPPGTGAGPSKQKAGELMEVAKKSRQLEDWAQVLIAKGV